MKCCRRRREVAHDRDTDQQGYTGSARRTSDRDGRADGGPAWGEEVAPTTHAQRTRSGGSNSGVRRPATTEPGGGGGGGNAPDPQGTLAIKDETGSKQGAGEPRR